mgnify:CR=1 FL=1
MPRPTMFGATEQQMKHTYIIPAICLAFMSCGGATNDTANNVEPEVVEAPKTDDELIRETIDATLNTMLNDPSSYEFVSLDLQKEFTLGENIQYRRDMFNGWSTTPQSEKDLWNAVLDSLETVHANELDRIMGRTYIMKYRANNAFGALVMNETYVQIEGDSPNFEVAKMTTERKKLFLNLGDIPNWTAIYTNVKSRLDD